MTRRFLPLVLSLVLLSIYGCDTVKKSWKWTKSYVDPAPVIDLEPETLDSEGQERLARLFTPVDSQLDRLVRSLSAQETLPSDEWYGLTLQKFPFLSGAFVVSRDGDIVGHSNEAQLKPVDPKPLLDLGDTWNATGPNMVAVSTDFGPEVYIGTPLQREREWIALAAVHFDPRNLIKLSPEPQNLVVFTPSMPLWSGDHEAAAKLLSEGDWNSTLRSRVTGRIRIGDESYTWISRRIGVGRIIYAVEDPEE